MATSGNVKGDDVFIRRMFVRDWKILSFDFVEAKLCNFYFETRGRRACSSYLPSICRNIIKFPFMKNEIANGPRETLSRLNFFRGRRRKAEGRARYDL